MARRCVTEQDRLLHRRRAELVIRPELVSVIERALADGVEDTFVLQQQVRRTLGRWVNNNFRRRPMILPIVVAT